MTTQDTPSAESAQHEPAGGSYEADLARIRAAEQNEASLRKEAEKLALQKASLQMRLERAKAYHEELCQKMQSLLEPQRYPVIITRVLLNGSRVVEVAGPGISRTEVNVASTIENDALRVGSRGVISRERNCLLEVNGQNADWSDVGTFERYVDDGQRILIRYQEMLRVVTLADSLKSITLQKGTFIGFDGQSTGLAFSVLEAADHSHLFSEDIMHDDFAQLAGLDRQVGLIKRMIEFAFRHPEVARRYRLPEKRGILLSGPPGNGKTKIARCVAAYLRALMPDRKSRFMSIVGSSDYSMWLGESERRIVERFEAARKAAAEGIVVLFFDELDAIGRRRGTDHGSCAPDRILGTFLGQLDGVRAQPNVIVIGATNRADTLDPALIRPGRFDYKVQIPAPNRHAAACILHRYLSDGLPLAPGQEAREIAQPLLSRLYAPNGEYAEVARVRLSDGRYLPIKGSELISGAALENVVRIAAEQTAAREVATGAGGVTEEDLVLALQQELGATVRLLSAANIKSYVSSIPQDAQPIAVLPTIRSA